LDWENDEVRVTNEYNDELKNREDSCAIVLISLLVEINATKLHKVVEDHIPVIESIKKEWGNSSKGGYGYTIKGCYFVKFLRYRLFTLKELIDN